MNRALWKKAVSDSWLHLAVSCTLLLVFAWVFVWLMSQLPQGAFASMLKWMPNLFKSLLQIPLQALATPVGQISVLYVHVITQLVCVGWALGRGSDSISGEIGRGTMDLILTLPVRRVSVMLVPAIVTAIGSAILAATLPIGTAIALCTFRFEDAVSAWDFMPGAINLFAMTFCLTGITTFVSSWSRDRWRTIAIAGGFYVLSFLIELIRRLWPAGAWLKYATFLSEFRPQELILSASGLEASAWYCNGVLLGIGLLCYAVAGVVLSRRDIPNLH